MSVWTRLRDWIRRDQTGRHLGEMDAPANPHDARTRATGGVRNPAAQDTYSTTGTTPSGMFVGRASGDETGDVGSSGAEARAEHARRHSRKPEQQRRSE